MVESLAAQSYIWTTLTNSSDVQTLIGKRVYTDIAPKKDPATGQPPVFPLVILGMRSGRDQIGIGNHGQNFQTRILMDVKVVSKVGWAEISPIADAVYNTLMTAPPLTLGESPNQTAVFGAYRRNSHTFVQTVDDIIYYYANQEFEVLARRIDLI